MSDFNKGVVWGRVFEVKYRQPRTSERKPQAKLTIECRSEKFGTVRAYGTLWGREQCEQLKRFLKDSPDKAFRFEGFFTQYRKGKTTYSGYNFNKFVPTTETQRASFILSGECTGKIMEAGERELEVIELKQEQWGTPGKFNTFRVYAPRQMCDEIPVGSVVQLNGTITEKDAQYGGTGWSRPVVKQFDIKQQPQEVF
jgi:hypothetical protein